MTAMRYRRFGRTGLEMPVFSCGGMRYQHSWKDVPARTIPRAEQANVEATLLRALELGVNHIETARGYGSSELQLGMVLPHLPREGILVQTKLGLKPSGRDFRTDFHTSLERLQIDHVDLLSLHGINNREKLGWALKKGGCLEAALELREQGLVRHVGFSTHATPDVIVDAIASDGFDYVNLHYYFVNRLNQSALREAARRDLGVFIISPNDKGGKLYAPPPKLTELCRPLTPMQFNDLYCLAHPEIHTLSIGPRGPRDFDEHVAALEHYEAITNVLSPILARLEAEMHRVLGEDFAASWAEGVPEYFDLPGSINVREIVRLWIYATVFDLLDWGKMRYNLLGRADDWFPGQNAAKIEHVALERALGESRHARRILDVLAAAHALLAGEPRRRLSQS
jgi:predicted aldo/keto reductase-like oxidoreductase